MKIAIISSTFPPYKGGMGNAAFYIARELRARGHNAAVFTPKYGFIENDEFSFKVIRLIPWIKYGNSAFCPQLFWRLWNYDIIYLVYPFFGGAEAVWLLKKIKGKKIKFFINYQMDVSLSGVLGEIVGFYSKFILPRVAAAADTVSFLSMDHGRSSLLKNLINKNPGKFIETANGVDAKKFRCLPERETEQLRKKMGIAGDERIIMFCGGLDRAHYFKGVDNLLRAFQRINSEYKSVKLLIVGGGDLKNHYQDLAIKLGLENKVIFSGEFGHNDLPYFYNICDVFVLPSIHSESFGIVLIEAMACGKPVVASNLPGVRATFTDKKHGFLVEPGNIADLAEKITIILNNNDLAGKMGENGRKFIKEKYTWENIAKKINEAARSAKP